jgi:hypothetical protein
MENKPEYIDAAIDAGYDVEIDVRYERQTGELYLGHDDPQYLITWYWLGARKNNIWIHCKNIDALYEFSSGTSGFNYFWHQEDNFTLTSRNYIWTYPGKAYTPRSIIVMPEVKMGVDISDLRAYNCFGVCSDLVGQLK